MELSAKKEVNPSSRFVLKEREIPIIFRKVRDPKEIEDFTKIEITRVLKIWRAEIGEGISRIRS